MYRLSVNIHNERKFNARRKFFYGMYAECSGLVYCAKGYMDSARFIILLNKIKDFLDEDINHEHHLFVLGKSFLNSKNKNASVHDIKNSLGDDWRAIRFSNLVRLGADIENAGLGTLSRATLVGSFLYQQHKLMHSHDL